MKIRTRLALALCGAAVSGLLIAGLISTMVFQTLAYNIFAFHQMKQTEILGRLAGPALSSRNEGLLRRHMEAMRASPGVKYAYVADKDRRIVTHTHGEYIGRPVTDWQASKLAAESFELMSPVQLDGRDLGSTVRVGYVRGLAQVLASEAWGNIMPPVILFGSLGVALSLLIALALAVHISRPLLELVGASQKVGAGNLEVHVDDGRPDEIGEVMRQFNAMVTRLKSLDMMKDEFIARVSHDLRNPMAAITMNLDYMLNESPDRGNILPEQRAVLTRAMHAATGLGVFVTNILDSAKMKAGRMEYRLHPVELEGSLRDMEGLYGVTAKQRGISLLLDVAPGLPPVQADPERLQNVLSNLVSNALKFTGKGGTVTVGAKTSGGAIEISVADTGQGISKESLPRLFQRFEQAGAAAGKVGESHGTGLGLYIVKQTVEAMGGTVAIDSDLGKGTRVVLRLPEAARQASLAEPRPAPPPPPSQHRLTAKIMIVDDDDSFSEVTRLLLEAKGYRTVVANEGRRAAEAAISERPDLILMDLDLRESRGADVIVKLKAHPATARIPVILCSASRDYGGAEPFLPKPLKSAELYQRIQQVLSTYSI